MKKNICIIHYNTPFLTECLIKSINKYVGKLCHIYIFDNSDKEPFTFKQDNITLFDNTKGQIINFEKILEQYSNRYNDGLSNYGSFKHCISIQKCIDLINDNFVLMDSDILIKKDFSDLYQEDKIFVGEIEIGDKGWKNRLCPYLCFLNVNMFKCHNIKFYHDKYIFGLTEYQKDNFKYDVGAYFLEQTLTHKHLLINIDKYMIHYHGGSWKNDNVTLEEWLFKNQELWDKEYKQPVLNKIIMTKTFKKEIQTRHKKINNIKRR